MTNEVQQAREALGYRLRDIRMDARVSGRQLAALAGWHFTKISKIEHGRSMPSEADIELWCFHCGTESQIADLTAAARGIEKMYVELKRLLRRGTSRYQQELLDEETRTRHFRIFDPAVIPGALQTPRLRHGAVHGVRSTWSASRPIFPATVAVRMERARLLYRGSVLPTLVRHYMTFCGFWIFDDREAQIETYSAAVRITQPREIAMYAKVFEHYSRRAVYGQQARDLISQAIAVPEERPISSNLEQLR